MKTIGVIIFWVLMGIGAWFLIYFIRETIKGFKYYAHCKPLFLIINPIKNNKIEKTCDKCGGNIYTQDIYCRKCGDKIEW